MSLNDRSEEKDRCRQPADCEIGEQAQGLGSAGIDDKNQDIRGGDDRDFEAESQTQPQTQRKQNPGENDGLPAADPTRRNRPFRPVHLVDITIKIIVEGVSSRKDEPDDPGPEKNRGPDIEGPGGHDAGHHRRQNGDQAVGDSDE